MLLACSGIHRLTLQSESSNSSYIEHVNVSPMTQPAVVTDVVPSMGRSPLFEAYVFAPLR